MALAIRLVGRQARSGAVCRLSSLENGASAKGNAGWETREEMGARVRRIRG